MKVLFINDKKHDYLSESLFHGLRSLLDNDCLDYPRYDQMYTDTFGFEKQRLRGNGFTLYGLLEDNDILKEKRKKSLNELIKDADLIILNDIVNQIDIYKKIKYRESVAILDGGDHPHLIPYENIKGNWSVSPLIFLSTFIEDSLYFKREIISFEKLFKLKAIEYLNLARLKKIRNNIKNISFSIPKEKITKKTHKVQLFNSHLIDSELVNLIPQSSSNYLFSNEKEYYDDLKKSKFGITGKRGGWDCLRHYELAANGAILCFKNFEDKPLDCAPHGLVKDFNCISYTCYEDLSSQIKSIKEKDHMNLLNETYNWIDSNTTIYRAKEFLENYKQI